MRTCSAFRILLVLGIAASLASCREPSGSNLPNGVALQTQLGSRDTEPANRLDAGEVSTGTLDLDFFKQAYSAHKANQEFQTEQEYLAWVREFYEAKATVFTPAGWNEQSQTLIAKLDSPHIGASVREVADRLGKRIAAEWAKDKRASKLDAINDLLKWGAEMKAAAEQDDGSGQAIIETLTKIEQEVAGRLRN